MRPGYATMWPNLVTAHVNVEAWLHPGYMSWLHVSPSGGDPGPQGTPGPRESGSGGMGGSPFITVSVSGRMPCLEHHLSA
jgi:hypothetical protein